MHLPVLATGLFTALVLAGCPAAPEMGFLGSSCGERLDYDYGPSPWADLQFLHPQEGEGGSLVFSWDIDGELACIDQHASYRAGLVVVGKPDCSEEAPVVVVKTQAGLTGRSINVAGKGGEGRFEYLQDGEIGLGQFKQPQYVFLTLEATFPGGEGAVDPDTGRIDERSEAVVCARSRVQSIELHLDYDAPPEAEETTPPAAG